MSAQERRVVHERLKERGGDRDLQRGRRAQPLRDRRSASRRVSRDPLAALDPRGARALGNGPRAARRRARLGQLRGRRARLAGPRRRQPHRPRGAPSCDSARRIADVGAGAGFPGLALAVALPDAQVDLVESVGRKCEFMRRAIGGGRNRQRQRPQHPLRGPRLGERARVLRRRHRPRRGAPLDPGRARIPAPEAKRRPHRLEGQARRRGGGAASRRRGVPGDAARSDPRRRRPRRQPSTATSTSSGRSGPRPRTFPASPASPRSARRAEAQPKRLSGGASSFLAAEEAVSPPGPPPPPRGSPPPAPE